MNFSNQEDQFSDDEVFFGKLSLKEIKKRVLGVTRNQNQTMAYANSISDDGHDESVKIIETHSEPNLLQSTTLISAPTESVSDPSILPNSPQIKTDWDLKVSDDSFLKMEKMMSESCSLSETTKEDELDNTLEVIEFILNNGPNVNNNDKNILNEKKVEKKFHNEDKLNIKTFHDMPKLEIENENIISPWNSDNKNNTQLKEINKKLIKPDLTATPIKTDIQLIKTDVHTPNTNMKTPIFKTPLNILSHKKPSAVSLKKTPFRNNAFQHIASPVASYIKNGPQVTLLKDVRPKKPLPGPSSIPKLVKSSTQNKPGNKENVILPSIAYRSAKNTKVINIPDEDRLPQSQWAKKITSSLPKPLVMKHDHREMNFAKKRLLSHQEDSFADLSLHQAEISVCTQKSAISKSKQPL